MKVLTMPRVDTLTVSGITTAEECGFIPAVTAGGEEALYRPGWWGVEKRMKKGRMAGRTLLNARAEHGSFQWPQAWGVGRVHPTRVDVCCDFEGFAFSDEHRKLFTMKKGKSATWYAGDDPETIYIGSGAVHTNLRLRIYLKSRKCSDADRRGWANNGWSGGDVWRVEAQVRERGLPRELRLPEQISVVWNDALARYRMCSVNPRECQQKDGNRMVGCGHAGCQQNKVPTHQLWAALGEPARHTRARRAELQNMRGDYEYLRRFERLMVAAGVRLFPRLLEKLQKAMIASGGTPHGQRREESPT